MESYRVPNESDFESAWQDLTPYKRDILLRMLDSDIELSAVGVHNASLATGVEHELTLNRWTDREIPKPTQGYPDEVLDHRLKLTRETRIFLENKTFNR
jgi:hypothetical protein